MAEKKTLFESKQTMSRKELAGFLRTMADRIEKNTLVLKQENQRATETILPEQVVLETELREKTKKSGKKYKLELEIEWVPGTEIGSGVRLA